MKLSGLSRSDGKCPDGCNIHLWKSGKVLVWDATCPDTYAPSHISAAVREVGALAAHREHQKTAKYAHFESSHLFVPFTVETKGGAGSSSTEPHG